MSSVALYDDLSQDYDRFVNWPARLSFELPFFRQLFARYAVRRVLDVACGTGQHAIALAREGYEVTATDLSAAMIARARENAAEADVEVRLYQLGFGQLAGIRSEPYDAVLCLGNSLPHAVTDSALQSTLGDLAAVLKPGGVLVIQNRNFDRVLARQDRFMSPEVHRAGHEEWIFMRFYDFQEDLLRFNVLSLHRSGGDEWSVRVGNTQLKAWRFDRLQHELIAAGLEVVHTYGSYRGEIYDPSESGDLILLAARRAS